MKRSLLLFLSLVPAIWGANAVVNRFMKIRSGRPAPVPELEAGEGGNHLRRELWFSDLHRGPDGTVPPDLADREAQEWARWSRAHQISPSRKLALTSAFAGPAEAGPASLRTAVWTNIGPFNVAGRVLSVAFDPSDANTIWAGTAGGGVYRSTDFGVHWHQMGGDQLPSLWIGAIAIDRTNPKIIYCGTGEQNTNYGGYGGFGGLLKSTDDGETFAKLSNLNEYGFFKTLISVSDHHIVLTLGGQIYRSTDSGANWSIVFSHSFSDMDEDPANPHRYIGARANFWGDDGSTLMESTDDGATWHATGAGLPDPQDWGRTAIAFSPTIASRVYLAIAQKIGGSFTPAFYVSDDGGRSYTQVASDNVNGYQGVGWYGAHLAVSPSDHNVVIQNNGGSILITTDGGVTWRQSSGNWHVDTHGVAFSRKNPTHIVCATDGGVSVSPDAGQTFYRVDQGFPTVQYYDCAAGLGDAVTVFGSTQDNWMNVLRPADQPGIFEYTFPPGRGDVGAVTVDPTNPSNVEAATVGAADIGHSSDGGVSWSGTRGNGIVSADDAPWDVEMVRDPVNPSVLFLGMNRVYKSADGGLSWQPIVVRPELQNECVGLVVSPANDAEVYSLWDDGEIFVSGDGGATWQERDTNNPYRLGGRRMAAGPSAGSAYAVLSGSSGLGRIWRTTDSGLHWDDISEGLPQVTFNGVLADPRQPGRLLVAADDGVLISEDEGQSWSDFSMGLPRAVFLHLDLDPKLGRLVLGSYGRGLWELKSVPFVGVLPPGLGTVGGR